MSKLRLNNMVSVYGSGIGAPLLQTNDARLIQIRDSNGAVMALLFRLSKSLWGFSASGDPDWEDHLKHLEVKETVPEDPKD